MLTMKNKLFIPFLLAAWCAAVADAQPLLTADEAVSIALKNNYDILVARNDAEIAKVNNTPGNAGMLPTIAVAGSDNYSLNTGYEKLVTPPPPQVEYSNVGASVFAAEALLNWTLFDGGKMFVTKKKLGELESLGMLQFKTRVLQTAYDVTAAYYDVVRQKQQLASIREVITYNQEQVTIMQTSFGAGLSPKTTLLQAEIDLNVFKENALAQEVVITMAKRALNLLLCRDSNEDFNVSDSIPLTYVPDKTQMVQRLLASNVDILSFEKQVEVARLTLQEARTLALPKIAVSGGYAASQIDNPQSTFYLNRTYGPQVGGMVTIPLYQAGNVYRQITAAKLQLSSTEYDLKSTKLSVASQLQNALDEFENQRELLAIERANDALAKENLDISMERLRLGQSTSLELRQAQESYEDSRTRLINIEYNLKAAETKLKQLVAEL
jgi:outer membrane protein TolC